MKLNKRLQTIANMVESNSKIIDVGCDHGLLDIYLTLNKSVQCIASDVSEKCIKKTQKNIKKFHLEDKIKTIVSDGLEKIDVQKIDTIIISGMGTHTILNILQKHFDNNLIIQSNNNLYELRKEIIKKGYYIEKEEALLENDIYYVVIFFKKGNKKYNDMELEFGPFMNQNKDYINYLLNKYINIYKKVTQEDKKENLKKKIEYLSKL